MLQNYVKIAIRNLLKNRVNSVINISGLTIGLTAFILICLYIRYELSYDDHFKDAHQIYRVAQIHKGDVYKGSDRSAVSPAPLGPTMKEEFPEIEATTTLHIQEQLLTRDEHTFYENGLFANEFLFDVFSFSVIEGEGEIALQDPASILLTRSTAKKYFGETSPINQTITLGNERLLTVKGVVEDNPANQHFTFDYITSWKNLPFYDEQDVWYSNTSWYSHNYYTYVLVSPTTHIKTLESKLATLGRHYDGERFPNGIKPQWFLQALPSIHLHSQINEEIGTTSDIRYIYLFASIAFIILLLACINYVNLSTAQSPRRAKEVGVRKVLGSDQKQLRMQFLSESMLFALISLGLAMGLLNVLLPPFNQVLELAIPFDFLSDGLFWIFLLLGVLLIGLLSGWYPALILSAVAPITAFKGLFLKQLKNGLHLRNALVVGQFAAAIILAIGSIVIYQQLQYIQKKKLGYNRDRVIYIPYRGAEYYEKTAVIRSELMNHPQIENVSFTTYLPLDLNSQTTVEKWEGNSNQNSLFIYRNYIDASFLDLFEIETVEGREFTTENRQDSINNGIILNESAVKALGWKTAVGKQFQRGKVIGVVKDFHFQTFDLAIEPLFMAYRNQNNSRQGNIAIKVKMENINNTLAHVQGVMKKAVPNIPFEYRFMDASYDQLYRAEKRISQVLNIFTVLALAIACVGLFGLVTDHVLQRTKEIGIRKVLGASVFNIIHLLSRDFVKLVAFALLIAVPIAWWGARQWLKEFAYRIDIHWQIFALAGLLTMGLAVVTISLQSLRAATANPVDALRDE